jgi:hypothetical protein
MRTWRSLHDLARSLRDKKGLTGFAFSQEQHGSTQQQQSYNKIAYNGISYRYKLSRTSTTGRTKQRLLSLSPLFHHSLPVSKRICDYLYQQLRPLSFDPMQSADKTIAEYLRQNSEEFRTLDEVHQEVSCPCKIRDNRQS